MSQEKHRIWLSMGESYPYPTWKVVSVGATLTTSSLAVIDRAMQWPVSWQAITDRFPVNQFRRFKLVINHQTKEDEDGCPLSVEVVVVIDHRTGRVSIESR